MNNDIETYKSALYLFFRKMVGIEAIKIYNGE